MIKPATPHQQYERKLVASGLNQTAMGTVWINSAQQILRQAIPIKLPYQEKGYFAAEKVEAAAFRFKVIQGQRLTVQLTQKLGADFKIYVDVWMANKDNEFQLLASADTVKQAIQLDVEQAGEYVLRVQPELLKSGEFTLSLQAGPSLGYPLKAANRNQIQSLFGVGRDDNTRKHEGLDIFGPFRTPVIAVAPGVVTRVNTNTLGGKVVWLRPEGKNYTVYYAHLDEQIATEGQAVSAGDTLGRMGNTGNARTTPPHLHFGIYTSVGAVDPFPFIDPRVSTPTQITANTAMLNTTMRTTRNTTIAGSTVKAGTIMRVNAAAENEYRIQFPDGKSAFVVNKLLRSVDKPVATLKVKTARPVFDQPDSTAAVKLELQPGQTIQVLGTFGDYQLMVNGDKQTGWILKQASSK